MYYMKKDNFGSWCLLVLSLPTESATARMRIWRSLKTQGCAALRDGAYLLPDTANHQAALQALAGECVQEKGNAWVMKVLPQDAVEASGFKALFDRTEEHAALVASWKAAALAVSKMGAAELTRLHRKLGREYEALCAIDFFPNDASAQAATAWAAFNQRVMRELSPDEPQDSAGLITRLDSTAYQARVWATRRGLWVDRAASAWLIRRFIDPQASFKWLAKPPDCPRKALGFDFDGATFTHVGERVTFEVLMLSFGLEGDAALERMGTMVRSLDTGGEAVAEAAGFEAILAGARERLADDDALLEAISGVLDSLYTHFQGNKTKRAGA
jgi:hypothetical protein